MNRKISFFLLVSMIFLALGIGSLLWTHFVEARSVFSSNFGMVMIIFGALGILAELLTNSIYENAGMRVSRGLSGLAIAGIAISLCYFSKEKLMLFLIYGLPLTIGFVFHIAFIGVERGRPLSSNQYLRNAQVVLQGIKGFVPFVVVISAFSGFCLFLLHR